MRTLLLFLSIVALTATFGCNNRNNDQPAPNETIVYGDSAAYTGRLYVHVRRWTGNNYQEIANAYVSIHNTYEDAAGVGAFGQIPIIWDYTLNDGIVDFGYMNMGNYYIYAEVNNGGQIISKIAAVQVQNRLPVTRQVIFDF